MTGVIVAGVMLLALAAGVFLMMESKREDYFAKCYAAGGVPIYVHGSEWCLDSKALIRVAP